jgi:hypothetical protein
MKISISSSIPPKWRVIKPVRSYETNFIYIGVQRYNTFTKAMSSIERTGDTLTYKEEPCTQPTFSSSYANEPVRVTVYSESPRVWSEELSPHEVFFFVQQPTQAV